MLTAREKIIKAKISFRKDKATNFFSYLVSQFKIMEDVNCTTASVSADKEIVYNPKFINCWSSSQVVFILAHEVLHYALKHVFRIPHEGHQKANMAMDLKVNDILITERIGTPIEGAMLPCNHTYELSKSKHKIINIHLKTAEQIYDEIPDEDVDEGLSGNGGMDDHICKNGTTEQISQHSQDMAGAVSAQQQGFKSADMQRLFKDVHDPIIPWKSVLARFVQPFINDSYSWSRLNRKTLFQGILLPGYVKSEKVKGVFTVDTSGSMSEPMLNDVVSEIKGLLNSYGSLEIKLLIGDSDLKEEHDMTQNFDINEIKMKGGGGTSHEFMYEYLEENNADFCIAFTDGYSDIQSCHKSSVISTPILWLVPEGCIDLSEFGIQCWMAENGT